MGHHHDCVAQVFITDVAQVHTVKAHDARGRVIEPRHQFGQRRLARTGGAHQSDGLTGRNVETELVQNLFAVAIREANALEFDVSL